MGVGQLRREIFYDFFQKSVDKVGSKGDNANRLVGNKLVANVFVGAVN